MDKQQLVERFAGMEPKLDRATARICDAPELVELREKAEDLERQRQAIAAAIAKLQTTGQDTSQAQADARALLQGVSLDQLGETPSVASLERQRAAVEGAVTLARDEYAAMERHLVSEQCATLESVVNRHFMVMLSAFEATEEACRDVEAMVAWLSAKKIRIDMRPAPWQLWPFEVNFLMTVDNYIKSRRESMKTAAERDMEAKGARVKGILERVRGK